MKDDELEYSIRLIVRASRPGKDTPERRHKIVKALRDWITRTRRGRVNKYEIDVCEIREVHLAREDSNEAYLRENWSDVFSSNRTPGSRDKIRFIARNVSEDRD
jgi:hypothetical protein